MKTKTKIHLALLAANALFAGFNIAAALARFENDLPLAWLSLVIGLFNASACVVLAFLIRTEMRRVLHSPKSPISNPQ